MADYDTLSVTPDLHVMWGMCSLYVQKLIPAQQRLKHNGAVLDLWLGGCGYPYEHNFWTCRLQATIRQPSTTNIYKALGMQFTVGTFPFLVLTFVGYWAYGSAVQPYLLLSLHGPKSLITIANSATFLQALVCLHVSFPIFHQAPKMFCMLWNVLSTGHFAH